MKLFLTINIHYFIHSNTSLIYESVNTLKILFFDIFSQMYNVFKVNREIFSSKDYFYARLGWYL